MGKGKSGCFSSLPTPGPGFSDHMRERFMYGDCWLLADRVSALTGWPVLALVDSENPDSASAVHALLETPDGKLLDAQGIYSSQVIFDLYDSDEVEYELVPMPKNPGWSFSGPPLSAAQLDRAARQLLEWYKSVIKA